MDKADVTVIVPAHQCAKTLPTLLAHLELQSHPAARLETIIVDLGSSDGTAEVAARYADGAPIRTQCLSVGPAEAGRGLAAAVTSARGRWLLFLHQDLLAGTHLIRTHVRTQERHGGSVAIRGSVDRHPQAGRPLNLQPYLFSRRAEPAPDSPLPFPDWRMWNLSISKDAVERAGGISEAFPYPDYLDVHLAWRMRAQGVEGYYQPEATAYAWYVPDLGEERRRAHARGYSRQVLLRHVQDDDVRWRFSMEAGPVGALWHSVSDPVWRVVAGPLPSPHGIRMYAARQLLRHDMKRGYRAAASGARPTAL